MKSKKIKLSLNKETIAKLDNLTSGHDHLPDPNGDTVLTNAEIFGTRLWCTKAFCPKPKPKPKPQPSNTMQCPLSNIVQCCGWVTG